jgi:hypothetical protein
MAAHRTLPFGTRVRVTNLETNQATEVQITDRGPKTKQHLIDLSQAAAWGGPGADGGAEPNRLCGRRPETTRLTYLSIVASYVMLRRSSLCWGCSRIGFFCCAPVVVVAQAVSREDHEQQRHRPKADHKRQETGAAHDAGGKELTYKKTGRRTCAQDGEKHAALRVVEEPRIEDGHGD